MPTKRELTARQHILLLTTMFVTILGLYWIAITFFNNYARLLGLFIILIPIIIKKLYVKSTDENYLAPIDRSFNLKKRPFTIWLPIYFLFIGLIFVTSSEGAGIETYLTFTLIYFFLLGIYFLGYYIRIRDLGYELKNGKWRKKDHIHT